MSFNALPQQGRDDSDPVRDRQRWEKFLTLVQAQQGNDGKHGVYYAPLTGLWVLVPDAEGEHVPETWFHVGR